MNNLRRNCLLGNLEESLLAGRMKETMTLDKFQAEIVASDGISIFCPNHRLPVTTKFYEIPSCTTRPSAPYMAKIQLDKQGYRVPPKGTVQVTLMNPCGSVVRIFLVQYDLQDMPVNSVTFLRQRILFCPTNISDSDAKSSKFLKFLIHLRFKSTKSGRIFLTNEIKVIVINRSDLEAAAASNSSSEIEFETRSIIIAPNDPKYSKRIKMSKQGVTKRQRTATLSSPPSPSVVNSSSSSSLSSNSSFLSSFSPMSLSPVDILPPSNILTPSPSPDAAQMFMIGGSPMGNEFEFLESPQALHLAPPPIHRLKPHLISPLALMNPMANSHLITSS